MHNREIRELIDIALDGTPTDQQTKRLDELLASDEEARKYYIEEMVLIHDLERGEFSISLSLPLLPKTTVNRWAMGVAVMAPLVAVAMISVRFRDADQARNLAPIVPQAPVAKIISGSESRFDGLQPVGLVMNTGSYSLESGSISLKFRIGASVEIVGPAKFAVKTDMLMELSLGNARIHAPDSVKGFLVEVPGMNVRDLGTEFGVSVAEDKTSEVHVFLGAVELMHSGGEHKVLEEGKAIS